METLVGTIYREEEITDIIGICTSPLTKEQPLIRKNQAIRSELEPAILTRDKLQGMTCLEHLTKSDYELNQIFEFIRNGLSDLEHKANSSFSKKELELDELFDNIIAQVTCQLQDMKSTIKSLCFDEQKKVINGYYDTLNRIYKETYDSKLLDEVLESESCHKATELPKIKAYIACINSPERTAIDELFKGIYSLMDSPLSFGEVPKINGRIFSQIPIVDINHDAVKNILMQFGSLMGFESFSKIIKATSMFPITYFPFELAQRYPDEYNLLENGWITSLASYPPMGFMHQVGDSRLPFIHKESKQNDCNAIIVASTEGNVRVFGTTGKPREVYKLQGIVHQLLSLPPMVSAETQQYQMLVGAFCNDLITFWDMKSFEKVQTLNCNHDGYTSAALVFPWRYAIPSRYMHLDQGAKQYEHKYILLTTGQNSMIKTWTLNDFEFGKQIPSRHKRMIEGMAVFNYKLHYNIPAATFQKKTKLIAKPDRKFLLITYDSVINIWDFEQNKVLRRFHHDKTVNGVVCIDYSIEEDPYRDLSKGLAIKDKKMMYYLIFYDLNQITIMNYNSGKIIKKIGLGKDADGVAATIKKVDSIFISLDPKTKPKHYLMVATSDKKVLIYDWKKAQCVKTIDCGFKFDGPTALVHNTLYGSEIQPILITSGRRNKKILQIYRY